MAPFVPEEVDVFSVPHSRMKALVDDYFQMLHTTNFSNHVDLELFLESLYRTFVEFKTHEQIENKFIMKKLKSKLDNLKVQNHAVCNCHKDNVLLDMLGFIKDGFKKKTVQDRLNYGMQLKQALEDFTNTFLPHMKEEEEVFQPLLLQYFSYDELCELKQNVITQHLMRKKANACYENSVFDLEKWVKEDCKQDSDSDEEVSTSQASTLPQTPITDLPPELMHRIFSHLSPKDLLRGAQVCRAWADMCTDPQLWRSILPLQWAQGDWSFKPRPEDEDAEHGMYDEDRDKYSVMDDDADIDESADNDVEYNSMVKRVKHEAQILTGISRHLVTKVGTGVRKIVLSNCRTLTNGMVQKLLCCCPNVEHLDLSYTNISDATFKSVSKVHGLTKLKVLNLSGCVNICDISIVNLAVAMTPTPSNSDHGNTLEGEVSQCQRVESYTVEECLCEELRHVYQLALVPPSPKTAAILDCHSNTHELPSKKDNNKNKEQIVLSFLKKKKVPTATLR